MTEVIYEFNARNGSPANPWNTNPANMVNGTETDYAETDDGGDEEELTGNECAGTDLGTITKVELRFYGYGDDNDEVVLTPVFGGSDHGDDHPVTPGVGAGWKAWQEISIDTNSPPTDYESYESGSGQGIMYGNQWQAQTFTPGTSHDVERVQLKLKKYGLPTGTFTVSIRATDGSGHPTGADLGSATMSSADLTTSYVWYSFYISSGVSVSASTKYAIVARLAGGDASNRVDWAEDTSGTYTGGNGETSADGGGEWDSDSAYDEQFREGSFWAWSDVQNLDCDVEYDNTGKSNTMYVGMVQIQVTYTEAGATYNRTCTVTLSGPSLSLARVGTFGRTPSRTGSASQTLVRVGDFSRAPSRTGSVALSLDKSVAHPRAVSRVGSVVTSLARSLTNLRTVTRTGSVSTSAAKLVTFVRSVTRTGSVSASAVAVKLKERAVSRVGSVATSLARTLTNLRGVTRTGSVATVLTKAAIFPRAISRVGSVVTGVVASISLERSASRTGSVSTALEWTATIGRAVSRVGSVATSLVRSGEFSRTVTRTGSVATSVARQLIEEGVEFFTGLYRRIIG